LVGGFALESLAISLGSTVGSGPDAVRSSMVPNLLALLSPAVFLAALPRFIRCFLTHRGQRGVVAASTVLALTSLSMALAAVFPYNPLVLWGLLVPHAAALVLVVLYGLAAFRLAAGAKRPGQPDPGPVWRRFLSLAFWFTMALFPLAIACDLFQLPRLLTGFDLPRFMPILAAALSLAFLVAQSAEAGDAFPDRAPPDAPPAGSAAAGQGLAVGLAGFGLSPREAEVAELLLAGLSYPAIAVRLFVSAGTVKTHVLNVYKKTGVRTKIALLHLAQSRRLLDGGTPETVPGASTER
jgi:DNA-binding CsgD family transcriptional regulator